MNVSSMGKWMFFGGLGLAVLGLLVWLSGGARLLPGNLPGDVRVERNGFSFYFPIATAMVLSAVLTVVINVLIRLFRK